VSREEQILVRVTSDTKQTLEDYVDGEDNSYDSVSSLMRHAALSEADGYYLRQSLENAIDNVGIDTDIDADKIVSAVEAGLSNTDERIEQVEEQLARIDEQLSSDDEITDLARQLKSDWLLELPNDTQITDIEIHSGTEPDNPVETAHLSGSPQAIADVISHPERKVRSALRRAFELYPRVKRTLDENNGITRYWVSNPEKTIEDELSDDEIEDILNQYGGFTTGTDLDE
jgi:hypothetical protein